jgi:hypothetical protein
MDEQYALVPTSMGKNTKMFMYATLLGIGILVIVTFGWVLCAKPHVSHSLSSLAFLCTHNKPLSV